MSASSDDNDSGFEYEDKLLLRAVMALVARANPEGSVLITEDEINGAGDIRFEPVETPDGMQLRITVLDFKGYDEAVADGDISPDEEVEEEWDVDFNAPVDILGAVRKKN